MLTLRSWTTADAPALLAATGTDPDLLHFTGLRITTTEAADEMIARQLAGWQNGTRYSFAVLRADTLVGNVSLTMPAAEVGYWTAAPARGQGIAAQALQSLTTWAFDRFAMPTLTINHQVDNTGSCRVATKAGYPLAEVLPPHPPWPLEGHRHTIANPALQA